MTAKKFPISSENSINTKVKENKHKQANKQTKVRKHDLPQQLGVCACLTYMKIPVRMSHLCSEIV